VAAGERLKHVEKDLLDVVDQLHDATVELRRAMHAQRTQRRTPDEIRATLTLARSVVYRSRVIRRALKARFRVQ
jgi:hypothetical protein